MKRKTASIIILLIAVIAVMLQYKPVDMIQTGDITTHSFVLDASEDKNQSVSSIDTFSNTNEMRAVENYKSVSVTTNARCSRASMSTRNAVILLLVFIVLSSLFKLCENFFIIHSDKNIVLKHYYISYMQDKDGRKDRV